MGYSVGTPEECQARCTGACRYATYVTYAPPWKTSLVYRYCYGSEICKKGYQSSNYKYVTYKKPEGNYNFKAGFILKPDI